MHLRDGRTRKRRRNSDDATIAHSLTFSCFHKQPLLSRERTCQWLVESLESARQRFALDLWAYVLMPDHVHLVIRPREDEFRIRSVLSAIKLPVSRRAIAWLKTSAPAFLPKLLDAQPNGTATYRFWQRGGGYDRDLQKTHTIHETIDYIHANPVRAGLVERPELWRWSSAAYFAGTGDSPLIPDVDSIPSPPKHWRY